MAAVVPESSASRIAGDFVFWNSGSRAGSGTLRLAHVVKSGGADRIYIYNVDGGGWVMVSGDDNTRRQVLGYSSTGRFDYSAMPVNARNWIESYADVISRLESHPEYVRRDSVMQSRASGAVAPLLGEIAWDQVEPYNLLCPTLSNGERAVTGCVATAMAQIMMYHRYPAAGQGRASYEWNGQTLSADFGKYDWDLMAPKYTGSESEASRQAVATLMRDCGYSVKMDYGPESGANFYSTFSVLVEKFSYDKSLIYLPRNNCDTESWERVLREELDDKRPVLYSGTGNGGSHAFVCDGYDDKGYFHFNWGWSGSGDGYFISGENLFPYSQSMIYGIQPDFGGKGKASLIINYLALKDKKVSIRGQIFTSYNKGGKIEVGYALENRSDGSVIIRSLDKINVSMGNIEFDFAPDANGLYDGEYMLYPMVRFEGEENWNKTSFLPEQFPDATDRYIELTVKDGLTVMSEVSWTVDGVRFEKYLYGHDGGVPIEHLEVIDAEIGNNGELIIPSKVKINGEEYEVKKISLKDKDNLITLVNSSPELQLELQGCSNLTTIKFNGISIYGGCDSPNLENIYLTDNLYNYSLDLYDTKLKKIDFPVTGNGLRINGWALPDSVQIYLHSAIPPTINNNEIRDGVEFHVPYGTKDVYLSAGFGKMGTVIEEEFSSSKFSVEWGMSGGVIPNGGYYAGMGIRDGNNNVELAVKFNRSAAQTYKGKRITAINFYTTGDDISYVFLSDTDKGYITKQHITPIAGMINRVILKDPFLITGEPIYFGFGNTHYSGISFADLDREVEDHFYVRLIGDDNGLCNIPPNVWQYYGKSHPLPITVTIEGEDMPVGASILNMDIESVKESSRGNSIGDHTMSVEDTNGDGFYLIKNHPDGGKKIEKVIDDEYIQVPLSRAGNSDRITIPEVKLFGDSCRVKVFLQNRSLEKITSFKLCANVGNRMFEKDFAYSLAMNQSAYLYFSFPIKELEDNFELNASVVEVNGRPDEIIDDGVTTARVMNYSRSETYPLKAVVEKGTSAVKWDYFESNLKIIEKEWPDNYIGINIHYDDEMANPENYDMMTNWMGTNCPWIITNRMSENSYINMDRGWPQMSSYFIENSSMATESVKITKAVTNGEECEVSAVVSTAYPADGKSFALAFVVLEDQVGPYPQKTEDGEVNDLFDNVARGIYGEFNGMTGLLPEKMATNASYPVTYSFTMPKNIRNIDNTKIVALLLDDNNRNDRVYPVIANADRMKLEVDRNMSGVDEVTEDADDIIKVEGNRIYTTVSCERFEVFTIDGKRTVSENLAKGFYVARAVVNGRTYVKKVVI